MVAFDHQRLAAPVGKPHGRADDREARRAHLVHRAHPTTRQPAAAARAHDELGRDRYWIIHLVAATEHRVAGRDIERATWAGPSATAQFAAIALIDARL